MSLNEYLKKFDYVLWLSENYSKLDCNKKPLIKHIVYIENLVNGVGVQTDKELFEEYLKVYTKPTVYQGFKYYYNKELDCIEYVIDDFIAFRKYDYGCIC